MPLRIEIKLYGNDAFHRTLLDEYSKDYTGEEGAEEFLSVKRFLENGRPEAIYCCVCEDVPAATIGIYDNGVYRSEQVAYCASCSRIMERRLGYYRVTKRLDCVLSSTPVNGDGSFRCITHQDECFS